MIDQAGNPFSTRRVRPGALEYLFPPDTDAMRLIDQLHARNWWGQIIGPHGTGKSTLVATLLPALRRAGREPLLITLHDHQRRLPALVWHDLRADLIVVDGYEQLGPWARFRLRRFCRRQGLGLLITAHKSVRLPQLWQTDVTPATALRVVERLSPGPTIAAADVAARFAAREGNLRETLFDLYDIHEQRKHSLSRNTNHVKN